MEQSFCDNYAAFIKANVDSFIECDDPEKCQGYREPSAPESRDDSEAIAATLHTWQRLDLWHSYRRALLVGTAFAGSVVSIVAFCIDVRLGGVTFVVSELIVLLLYFNWRPKI